MPALRNKPTTDFDIFNPEHVIAVEKVVSGGRVSDTELRFNVELPFTSVPTMAIHQMSQEYAKLMKGETSEKLIQLLASDAAFVKRLNDASGQRNFRAGISGSGKITSLDSKQTRSASQG